VEAVPSASWGRLKELIFWAVGRLALLVGLAGLPVLLLVMVLLSQDYVSAAFLVVFYSIALGMVMCKSYPRRSARTSRRGHILEEIEEALARHEERVASERRRFELACPTKIMQARPAEKADLDGQADLEDGLSKQELANGDEGEPCVICLEPIAAMEPCRVLSCRHAFHVECIDVWWLQRMGGSPALKCPICRGEQPTCHVATF